MNSSFLLQKLTPYRKQMHLIKRNQSVNDIMAAIKKAHEQYQDEYKKIAVYFWGGSKRKTGQKIWNYLKTNVPYKAEPDNFQTIKSPAAIIATGMNGTLSNDCKNYALFTAGILQALNDMGYKIPYSFRFASYNMFDNTPGHVFVVIDPGKNEIWVDPVLSSFNQKKQYTHSIDQNMMYSISGIGQTRKQKRQAKRETRKAAGKTLGQKLKKAGRGVLTVAAVVPRNSFLALVKLNVMGLATRLKIAKEQKQGSLIHMWEGLGGRAQNLFTAIDQGAKKKRILGIDDMATVGEPVTVSSLVASASVIIAKVVDWMNKNGIKTDDLKRLAANAVNNKIQQTIAKQEANQYADGVETENEVENITNPDGTEPGGTGSDLKRYLPLVLIGGAGLYFLTRKK
jgi:hypothetical protein